MKKIAENRKVRFDYEIIEKYEAGIELRGYEVKSVIERGVNMEGSHAIIRGGEVWLVGLGIPPYQPKNTPEDYDLERTRRLLLKKEEIKTLTGKIQEKRLTLVPFKIYLKNGKIKVELILGKSKKKRDKREEIKKRDIKRDIERELKGR